MEDAHAYHDRIGVIADGHSTDGVHGSALSTYVCKRLIDMLQTVDYTTYNPDGYDEMVRSLFQTIHDKYLDKMKESGIEIVNGVPMNGANYISGGTTLTCVVHGSYEGRPYIMTANVGDSDAFLFMKKGDTYTWEQLTTTHRPTSQEEYFRIQKKRDCAGHFIYETEGATSVDTYLPIFEADGTYIHYEDTYTAVEKAHATYHEARIAFIEAVTNKYELKKIALKAYNDYLSKVQIYKDSVDGKRSVSTVRGDRCTYVMDGWNGIKLSVTRSIGDYATTSMGISTEPSVYVRWLDNIDADRVMLFMATDGILDCYHMEELAKLVLESDRDTLMNTFVTVAKKCYNDDYDDMTFLMKQLC